MWYGEFTSKVTAPHRQLPRMFDEVISPSVMPNGPPYGRQRVSADVPWPAGMVRKKDVVQPFFMLTMILYSPLQGNAHVPHGQ